ncbi:MAG: Ig domain-containing protein, partial [Propionibacteriaceae bacterium]|nr:Ig domain-containing protein [Propionibacteriaceae bacterium]
FTVPVAGTASVTFAVSSETLPDGLILDPTTGAISGVPTVAGTYTFTITVTGPTGTATASYTISVAPLLLWETGGLARTGVGLALPVTAVLATLLTGAGVILTTWRRRGNAG